MKKLILIVLIVTGIILNSCEKVPFDYRNKFVGDYEFTTKVKGFIYCDFFHQSYCGVDVDVALNFKGKIYLGKEIDEIIIQYVNERDYFLSYYLSVNNSYDASINKDGKLIIKVTEAGVMKDIGIFDKKGNVNFTITDGALSHSVIGKKI